MFGLKVPLAPGLGMTWPQVDFGVILGSIFQDYGIHFPSKFAKMYRGLFKIKPLGIHYRGPRSSLADPADPAETVRGRQFRPLGSSRRGPG